MKGVYIMKTKFSSSFTLPDYLEEALAPFYWSSIFSDKFRTEITLCLMATNREEVTSDFVKSLVTVRFLDQEWKAQLAAALNQFAKEGWKGVTR